MTKANKVLFITQEITPYVPESEMSLVGINLPQAIQEKGREIRTFMPKWGNINERRNQLHEVIPVSYTHLDVYKRQPIRTVDKCRIYPKSLMKLTAVGLFRSFT